MSDKDGAYQRPPIDFSDLSYHNKKPYPCDCVGSFQPTRRTPVPCIYQGNEQAPSWCAKRVWYVELSHCAECEYREER